MDILSYVPELMEVRGGWSSSSEGSEPVISFSGAIQSGSISRLLQQYKIEIGSMESCNYLLFLVQVKRQKLVHVWIKTSSTF